MTARLPQRVAGATLPKLCPPPPVGWFGTEISWPTEDPDEHTLRRDDNPHDSSLTPLFDQLLHDHFHGLNTLIPPKPIDGAASLGPQPAGVGHRLAARGAS